MNDRSVAAIAHPSNAGDCPLEVLARDVQSHSSNTTRFFLLAPEADRSERGSKSSIIIYPDRDYSGLLLELLHPLAERNINLSRVDARPSGRRLGEYVIHLDIEVGYHEPRLQDAVETITAAAETGRIRWLGSYDTERISDE